MKIMTQFLTTMASGALLIGASPLETNAQASALPFKNLSMEEGKGSPAAWQKGTAIPGVEQAWDRSTAHTGQASLCLKKTVPRYFPIADWGQEISVEPSNTARKLQVRCWIKAEKVSKAILDVTYDSGHKWAIYVGPKAQSMPTVTHDWKEHTASVDVPARTSTVGIAFQIYGPGTVWFDDLEVTWVK